MAMGSGNPANRVVTGSIPAAGSSPGSGNRDTAQQQDQTAGIDDKNNQQDQVEPFKDLWQDPTEPTQDKSAQTVTVVQAPSEEKTADQAFAEHIAGLDLTGGIDFAELAASARDGTVEPIQKAFGDMAANIYRRAILDANSLVDKKIASAVEDAVSQATNKVSSTMATTAMHDALPFTKAPEVAPIATSVMAQFIKKGDAVPDAIEKVRAFFAHTAGISAKDLGLVSAPIPAPGKRGFNEPVYQPPQADDHDWMDALSMGQKTESEK